MCINLFIPSRGLYYSNCFALNCFLSSQLLEQHWGITVVSYLANSLATSVFTVNAESTLLYSSRFFPNPADSPYLTCCVSFCSRLPNRLIFKNLFLYHSRTSKVQFVSDNTCVGKNHKMRQGCCTIFLRIIYIQELFKQFKFCECGLRTCINFFC